MMMMTSRSASSAAGRQTTLRSSWKTVVFGRRSYVRPVCPSSAAVDDEASANSDAGERRDRMKHVRRILLAERKRLEDQRAESFRDISAALRKMAQDELSFIRSVVMRSDKKGVAADDYDGGYDDDEDPDSGTVADTDDVDDRARR